MRELHDHDLEAVAGGKTPRRGRGASPGLGGLFSAPADAVRAGGLLASFLPVSAGGAGVAGGTAAPSGGGDCPGGVCRK